MLSKILAETKFVQKVLTTFNSNQQILVKQKRFSSINTPNIVKIVVLVFYCESAILKTILPQEGKMFKFTGN